MTDQDRKFKRIMRRRRACTGKDGRCGVPIELCLTLHSPDPQTAIAADVYARTWLRITRGLCGYCRAPEDTEHLRRFEAFVGAVPTEEAFRNAVIWAALKIPHAGVKLEKVQ